MNVLLTHSYFLRFDQKQWKQRKPYPPLATIQVASNLISKGHSVELFDTNFAHSADEIKPYFKDKPEVLVIYDDGFNYLTKMCLTNMREAAFEMIAMAKKRSIPVYVSSSDSTDHFDKYLDKGADAVIMGEADATLVELLEGVPLQNVSGIAYKKQGEIVKNPPRAILKNLDDLPLPAWHLIDIKPYQKAWEIHGYFSINIATTRGCPFKCNWCAKPIYGNRYNSRSPEHVVQEIELIKTYFDFDHIWFCDDIFGLKPNWVQDFNEVLKSSQLSLRYKIQSRADLLVKDDTVKCLAESGCDEVWIGAESGSQKILDAMDKGTTIEQIEESTQLMKKHGVKACFFLQFGYLSEDWEDIQATLSMVDQLKPYDIGVSVSYPLPGTKFYEKVNAQLGNKTNWTDSDELLMMYVGTYPANFYKRLHRFVHKRFRGMQFYERLKSGQLYAFFKWFYFWVSAHFYRLSLYQYKT